MKNCNLCPNACNADRTASAGVCGVTDEIRIAKYYPHMYEEPVISGDRGSGAVFFCGCSLQCAFCQNYEVSRARRGKIITAKELADIFRKLEDMGVHNVNLVTGTHYADRIAEALDLYRPKIPVVWNTHGYETAETLELIDPYIDIYLPDLKFYGRETAARYCRRADYFEYASKAVERMCEKKLVTENGLMKSGTIVRHLVLPENAENTRKILEWFAPLKDKAYFSLMSQYTPFGKLDNCPELKRRLTPREYKRAVDYALTLGYENLFVQDIKSSGEEYIPSWDY